MLEIYVLLTLGTIGYILNKSTEQSRPINPSASTNLKYAPVHMRKESPSMKNIYDSDYSRKTENVVKKLASSKYSEAEKTAKDASMGIRTMDNAVVSDSYRLTPKDLSTIPEGNPNASHFVSSLTGKVMRMDEFQHQNPTPFFGSRMRQNMDESVNSTLLETFTGVSKLHCDKKETKSFYDGTAGQSFVNGAPLYNQFYQSRLVEPVVKNNVGPVEQQRVGPGLGLGYGTQPSGGFQQFETAKYAQDKSVDELRTKKNPDMFATGIADRQRETYKGRTLPGLKTGLRGDTGNVAPPKVDNTRDVGNSDNWLRTTGAVIAPTNKTGYMSRETQRRTTTPCSESIGPAFAKDSQARTLDPTVRPPIAKGNPCKNLEPGIASISRFGKGSDYDHGKGSIELYSNQRDVTLQRNQTGRNVGSLVKAIIAPVQDVLKLTRKNWSDPHPRSFGTVQIQIPSKQTVYDPTDVARTTIKETLIHDDHSVGIKGAVRAYVYDPEVVARKTVRETLDAVDSTRNVAGKNKITRRPDNATPNTTVKETTVDKARIYGNIDGREGGGAYETNEMDAKTTMRELWSEKDDHYGIAERDKGQGYLTNEMDAKITQKEDITANSEHYGGSEAVTKAAAKQDYIMDNAFISDMKESVLEGRDPTDTREKLFNAEISVAVPRKSLCSSLSEREAQGVERVVSAIPSCNTSHNNCSITKNRQADVDGYIQRLDPSLLSSLNTNPYALKR